mgnify:CR=1 FL=1
MKSVLTIHNLKFQGKWDTKTVKGITGLSDYFFTADKLEAYKDANLLKGGIVYADAVTTVSDTYAEDMYTGISPVCQSWQWIRGDQDSLLRRRPGRPAAGQEQGSAGYCERYRL